VRTRRCCEIGTTDPHFVPVAAPTTDGKRDPVTFGRRCLEIGKWIVPSAIVALLPKCPACLAAYLAIGTGLGFSLSTATRLRTLLLFLCIALLIYLVARFSCRLLIGKMALARAKGQCARIQTKEIAL
jgi:hypothetical protein